MSPPDLSSYRLSDDESLRIFTEEILPAEFPAQSAASTAGSNASSRSQPLAVLAVGQTGAGKTLLAPAILAALAGDSTSSVAHFIADTYKTYHPQYTRLMLSSPTLASPAAGLDARKWLAMAAREAVKRKLDVVLESACRHPDDFCELAQIFKTSGYRLEVVVLAVPEALSRLGLLTRFYQRRPEGQSRDLPVRLTPVKVHDDSYAGLIHAADFLDRTAVAHQVLVVRRGNLVAYSEETNAEGKASVNGIANAIKRERERPLTKDEMKLALDDIQNLGTNDETVGQVKEIRELLRPLISDSAQSKGSEFPRLVPLEFASRSVIKEGPHVLRLGNI